MDRLRAVWEDAVSLQLLSDVPIGVLLSGGVDSSSIVATLARLGKPVRSFSIAFQEGKFDESRYSRAVAQACQTEHQEFVITGSDALGQMESALASYDQPSLDGVNTYTISKAVREAGIKVALTGLGGDEVFAGYSAFRHVARLERLLNTPVRLLLWGLAVMMGGARHQRGRWAKLFALSSQRSCRLELYCLYRQLFSTGLRHTFIAGDHTDLPNPSTALKEQLGIRSASLDPVNALSLLEMASYMHNMLLRDTDQMSMAHALELRVPLLDHVFAGEVAKLQGQTKVSAKGEVNKWLLVELTGTKLPTDILRRRKMGFTFPWNHWLRQELKSSVSETLLDRVSVETAGLRHTAIAAIWQDYLNGFRGIRSSDVLALWHLVHWVRQHRLSASWS
jgi:asparagine synthase (glutamine-hydrolysing)